MLVLLGVGLALRAARSDLPVDPVLAGASGKLRERSALPSTGARIEDLLRSARTTPFQRREAWVASLDEQELRRLMLELLDEHLGSEDQSQVTPWLCAVAIETGERDHEGLCALLREWEEGLDFEGSALSQQVSAVALVGLARIDPAGAWAIRTEPDPADLPVLGSPDSAVVTFEPADLPLFRLYQPYDGVVDEAIFRAWARMDPEAAMAAVPEHSEAAIRGLLTAIDDVEAIGWLLTRLTEPRVLIPGTSFNTGSTSPEDWKPLLHRSIGGVSRNSIDAILNNPHRLGFQGSGDGSGRVLAGLAEHRPDLAWEFATGKVPGFPPEGDTGAAHGFGHLPEAFLSSWAARDPDRAIGFVSALVEADPQSIDPAYGTALARGHSGNPGHEVFRCSGRCQRRPGRWRIRLPAVRFRY